MENLFIVPLSPLQFADNADISGRKNVFGSTGADMFKAVFQSLVTDTAEAEKNYEQQKLLLATGQIEDAHTVTIAGSYAQLSVDMLVSMRNKALESYNELMRLSI